MVTVKLSQLTLAEVLEMHARGGMAENTSRESGSTSDSLIPSSLLSAHQPMPLVPCLPAVFNAWLLGSPVGMSHE